MKIGDLVAPKNKYSNNESGIGVILNVEEGLYSDFTCKKKKRLSRLTIFWAHGEITQEPDAYIDLISETSNERRA